VFWNQAGAVGIGTDIDSQFDGEASVLWNPGWLVMDVTQGVQAIQNGRSNFGWKLVPVSGNNNTKTFVSSDYAEDPTLRPALEIEHLLEYVRLVMQAYSYSQHSPGPMNRIRNSRFINALRCSHSTQ